MKHKVKGIHFVGSERTQSRSLLQRAAVRHYAAPDNSDKARHET